MSKKPLRTSELWEASKKPSIPEDIRQSRSRSTNFYRSASSTNLREKSVDKLTLSAIKSKDIIPNSAVKQRSLSVNATPRTPNSQIPGIRILTTTEKAETFNKKWLCTETNNILEYLNKVKVLDVSFFQKNNPLKSMSTKQFIQILNHFFKEIGGSKLKVSADPDVIIKILNNIEYPYQINKSFLKTPCAPHAHTNVIQLLSWLRYAVDESVDYLEEDAFKFSTAPIEAFTAWNNYHEKEYEQIKEKLCNEFLQERYQIENVNALNEEIDLLDKDIQKLKQSEPIINREDELLQIENDFKKLEQTVLKLESVCKSEEKKLNELKLAEVRQSKLKEAIIKDIIELTEKLKLQSMSREEHLRFTEQIKLLTTEVEIHNSKNAEQENINYKNQVLESRLIQEKTELLIKYNGLIKNISAQLKIDEHNCRVDKETTQSQLEQNMKFWNDINIKLIKINDLKQDEVNSLNRKLELLKHQFTISNNNLKEINKQDNEKQELLLALKKEVLDISNIYAKNRDQKMSILQGFNLTNQKLDKVLKDKNNFLMEIKKQNSNQWKELAQKTDESINIQTEKLDEFNKFLDDLEETLEKHKENA